MRTLLLGTDFMYNSSGALVPIEINTNIDIEYIQPEDEIFNLDEFKTFLISNSITKITYIGAVELFNKKLSELSGDTMEYIYHKINKGITIPYVEDSANHLIIRSAYDSTAIVDEDYCKNKVNFLNLIKNQAFCSQFAYLDQNGSIVNNIITIPDNGNHPNFILKSIFPFYDKDIYPKLYKVSNQSELNIILQNLTEGYYLTEFYYNSNHLYENHIKVYRTMNLLIPPDLHSIQIGQYTRLTGKNVDELSTFDNNTYEINEIDKIKYITTSLNINGPKLLDTDEIMLADGTFISALDLQNDMEIRTIIIPNPENVEFRSMTANYHIDYNTFVSGTTYSTNIVKNKTRVDKLVPYVKITFTDDTTWEDTKNSSYLVLKNDEVRFLYLDEHKINGLKIGDQVILIDATKAKEDVLMTVLKEVKNIETTKLIFGGWEISVQEEHLFLTRQEGTDTSYVAIEHNMSCYETGCAKGSCFKNYTCCDDSGSPNYQICVSNSASCDQCPGCLC